MQAMPLRRTTAAILAAVALSAALIAGCSKSSNQQSGAPLPDAATLLKQSAQTTAPAVAAKGHTRLMLAGDAAEADFVVLDGTLFGSLDPNSWNNFGPASDIYDVTVILNPDTGLANILSNFTNPKADGRETINGVQTIKITGQVSADAVNKIAPKVATGGTVPGTAWVREDGNHDLVQAKLEPSSGNSIQMTLSKWNDPVTVEKPPGV